MSFRLTAPGDDWLAAVPPLAALDRGPMPARVGNVGFGTASWTDRSLLASRAFYPPAVRTFRRRDRVCASTRALGRRSPRCLQASSAAAAFHLAMP